MHKSEMAKYAEEALQQVPEEHRQGVAPKDIESRLGAPGTRMIDHVIVDQRGGVREFEDRAEADRSLLGSAAKAPGHEQQRGAQPLALAAPDVGSQALHHRDLAAEQPFQFRLHRLETSGDRCKETQEIEANHGSGHPFSRGSW